MIVMADDARIGYPPVRVWGVPTTMMWVYRLGIENAKRMDAAVKDLGVVPGRTPFEGQPGAQIQRMRGRGATN